MLKDKKLDYQRQLEDYIEEQKVYEIFEQMTKMLITEKPKDPIKYLLQQMQSQEVKRLVLIGPPGSKRKQIALYLDEYLSEDRNFTCISVGDLINKEISKRSDFGKEIVESRKSYSYVKDEIVIELVKLQIELMEKDKKSWIIEGFPRTQMQALALQKMNIIPDKFILLNVDDETSIEKVKQNLQSEESVIRYDENHIDQIAQSALDEYKLQMQGVKKACKGFITEIDGNKSEQSVLEEIARVLKLKLTKAPRRPQRIILLGPPGSQKEEQALKIAEKYQLTYIQVNQLVKDLIRKEGKTEFANDLKWRLQNSEMIQDEIIIDLVKERLEKPDCKVNGWILDGCPQNLYQIKHLRELQIIPQLVIVLELPDSLVYEKLESKRFDTVSAKEYDILKDKIDPSILGNLVQRQEDTHPMVKRRLNDYKNFLGAIENEYRAHLIRINSEDSEEKVFMSFCDAIENSV